LVHWGTSIGPSTGTLVTRILERWPHPEQGYRACLGLLSLRKRYTDARLEAACTRALQTGATSYKSVKSILAAGLDRIPPEDPPSLRLPATHEHVRGADYYRTPPSHPEPALAPTLAPTLALDFSLSAAPPPSPEGDRSC
jgi:hypothetical protein